MKAYIGPYCSHISLYDFEKMLQKIGIPEDISDKIYKFLEDTWFDKLLQYINEKVLPQDRKVKLKIDQYDLWSMDDTLVILILPMLKKLANVKNGSHMSDPVDVPKNMWPKWFKEEKEYDHENDETYFKRWDYIMSELIWTFEQLNMDWEDQYHSGYIDLNWIPVDKNDNTVTKEDAERFRMENGPKDTHKFDIKGFNKHNNKINQGLILFGKYFRGLWW